MVHLPLTEQRAKWGPAGAPLSSTEHDPALPPRREDLGGAREGSTDSKKDEAWTGVWQQSKPALQNAVVWAAPARSAARAAGTQRLVCSDYIPHSSLQQSLVCAELALAASGAQPWARKPLSSWLSFLHPSSRRRVGRRHRRQSSSSAATASLSLSSAYRRAVLPLLHTSALSAPASSSSLTVPA